MAPVREVKGKLFRQFNFLGSNGSKVIQNRRLELIRLKSTIEENNFLINNAQVQKPKYLNFKLMTTPFKVILALCKFEIDTPVLWSQYCSNNLPFIYML